MKWTISTKILAGYRMAILLTLIVAFLAWRGTSDLHCELEIRYHINQLLNAFDNLKVLLLNAETGQRGFVIRREQGQESVPALVGFLGQLQKTHTPPREKIRGS